MSTGRGIVMTFPRVCAAFVAVRRAFSAETAFSCCCNAYVFGSNSRRFKIEPPTVVSARDIGPASASFSPIPKGRLSTTSANASPFSWHSALSIFQRSYADAPNLNERSKPIPPKTDPTSSPRYSTFVLRDRRFGVLVGPSPSSGGGVVTLGPTTDDERTSRFFRTCFCFPSSPGSAFLRAGLLSRHSRLLVWMIRPSGVRP